MNMKRYRFRHNELEHRPSLSFDELGITKNGSAIERYFQGFQTYLSRLSSQTFENNDSCPFCDFEILPDKMKYDKSNGQEEFVGTSELHQELWEEEYILTYNPSGWHLINEMFLPRSHISIEEFLRNELADILYKSASRWRKHRNELASTLDEDGLYHGTVANFGSGQSIQHAHVHCYSSIHPKREYSESREKLLRISSGPLDIELGVVPFDHPRCIVLTENIKKISTNVCDTYSAIFKVLIETYDQLFGFVPPASLGWFWSPKDAKFIMIYHPMQRRGTIQEFQSDNFHQFNLSTIIDCIKPVLIKQIEQSPIISLRE